ncbi:hypothetical protein PSPO01_08208 [Paraphaeosphaeria sporulosa]
MDGDEAPHWRVEHAIPGMATCTQAQCKNKGIQIEKSEIRIDTHQFHTMEEKYYLAWRHCDESREQLKLALGEGKVIDKDFKDIRPNLLVKGGGYMGELRDAVVEVVPPVRARCRAATCTQQRTEIAKGGEMHFEVRSFGIEGHAHNDTFTGINHLPKNYKAVVLESMENSEVIALPPNRPHGSCQSALSRTSARSSASCSHLQPPRPLSALHTPPATLHQPSHTPNTYICCKIA